MNRKNFIQKTLLTGAGALLAPKWLNAAVSKQTVCIMHTNDFHSRLDPYPLNHAKYPGQGGIAKLSTLIGDLRKQYKHSLLLDCGDIFQGTPYFNTFGGVPEIAWMNRIGYDAATLGNHDFDNGVQKLAQVLTHANFPVVNCNYDVENTPLKPLIKPFVIIRKNNLKIGITGIGINPAGLIPEHLYKGITYLDPVKQVQSVADVLKKTHHCDLVIVLSHLGYTYTDNRISDTVLAKETSGIDLILGGHTHTFLEKPVVANNKNQKPVIINQAGWSGLMLGKVVFG